MSRALAAAGIAAAALSAAWLQGCAASAPASTPASAPPRAAPPSAPPAVSHDFGGLLLVPFGTAFKDVPARLTEVLVFHPAGGAPASEDGDCFRPDVVASFLGRAPTDHLLCFDHDRLKRVEASVTVPTAEAPAMFAAACAGWQRGPGPSAPEPDVCEGRQGDVAFSARRSQEPDSAAATVTITLIAAAPP